MQGNDLVAELGGIDQVVGARLGGDRRAELTNDEEGEEG